MTRSWMAQREGDLPKAQDELRRAWDAGHHAPELARVAANVAAEAKDTAAAFTWLERALDVGYADPGGLLHAKALAPVRELPGYDALVERARKNAREARSTWGVGSGLEKTTPSEAGLSEPALAALLKAAEDSGSAGLVLLRHGKLVGEWYFGGDTHRIEAMSATKGMVALAIGLLIDEGKIPSLDTPVSAFFPEWKDGLKGQVTVRHLLNHTSGLAANRGTLDIYASNDFVRYALDSEVTNTPGSKHAYNNKATNLVAGIVERASGEKMDVYLARRLFAPLGIRDFRWDTDPSGNPVGMAGLQLHPLDFAKVGQMLLQGGMWQGQRILSTEWIHAMGGAPSQPHMPTGGLLWWLLYEDGMSVTLGSDMLEQALRNGFPEASLAPLREIADRPLPQKDFYPAFMAKLGGDSNRARDFMMKSAPFNLKQAVEGAPSGFAAVGQGGNRVIVLPKYDLVAVRMSDPDERVSDEVLEFTAFAELVLRLVRPEPTAR
ncbi:serine hydrolase domain-containing protein [Myxococcus faecalis]|uniref:serine hydrolase domain-containing protein n=1 Tax=Myxococcus faecalis TaxID=3115646 RepID=UPI0038CFD37E